MSVAACAALVQRGDPDRFRAVMATPVEARAQLFPLYAFNLEIARAPWVTQEPLIAEMRLQWWRDVVENTASGAARAHEVAGPLHDLIRDFGLPVEVMDRLIAARRWDIHRDSHAGVDGLSDYLEDTGAGLMWLAARSLGAPDAAETPVRAYGWATAAAMYIRAVPELEARGRQPLPQGVNSRNLARQGLEKLAGARQARKAVPKGIAPALLAGWQAEGLLRQAAGGRALPELPEAQKRWGLLWQAVSGRW
ncbi:squalene/phytoene synthase family protein [Tabrizicola sp.]|uniref:phytoene/squalene synthase family protein n=1 Tax=Tabrizicola sp. TaxID=2005166 RepID=UPI00273772B0|nr:squalene/phytoene synthase family protein [Tabrizicola sp.]MDP3195821.1 squalene/phytoene synthase family protein [Tabrizicola sp.]